MNLFADLDLNRKDAFYIGFLLLASSVITVKMIEFNLSIPMFCSDVIVYMVNALNFANMNNQGLLSSYSMFISPVICFITSILIRFSIPPNLSIFIVTGAFGIAGNLGLYLLFKNRFSRLLSLLGALFYSSLSLTLFWWANGTVDTSAVAVSIWIIVFTILAVDLNPRYYLIALPLFVVGFFTRYTVGFVLPLMILYFLSKHDIFKSCDNLISDRAEFKHGIKSFLRGREFKYIVISLLISAVMTLIAVKVILGYTNQLMFLTQIRDSSTGFNGYVNDINYNIDYSYYLDNFLGYIYSEKITFSKLKNVYSTTSVFSYLICLIMASGIILKVKYSLGEIKGFITESFKTANFKYYLIILMMILLTVALACFKVSFLLVDIPILIIAVILLSLHKTDRFRLSLLMVMWFSVYFVFFSLDSIKVDRYILTVMPAFAYMFIYALDVIVGKVNHNTFKKTLPVILIVICLVMSFNFTQTVEEPAFAMELKDVFDFLVEYDEDYANKEILSVSNRYPSWYLNKNVNELAQPDDFNRLNENISYIVIYNNHRFDEAKDKIEESGFEVIYKNSNLTLYAKSMK